MHLKQLKLAGFKSFVDPTVIPFPSQLVAVVGPNGCGKSNIIDAVRWVMGESSAKNLRGEAMTDVIFNGSSNRKSVGQASVELIFDNSLGRLTGQYAGYQEIAVKRLVTHDGDSSYFLNNTRCRRRDITDLFLGTGAGARGYSIIGQGTISRIVEARPEELRAYLEEAAGISKYKERRRETVTRITHTRENLLRVADIRDELDKQLQRLERQANTAQRYTLLKEDECRCKAEILALKWQNLRQEQNALELALNQSLLHYEQHQARLAETDKQRSVLREKFYTDNDHHQQLQKDFYQLAAEIARLEEAIQQQGREKQQLLSDEQLWRTEWQTLSTEVEQEKQLLAENETAFAATQAALQQQQSEHDLQQQSLQHIQQQQRQWQIKAEHVQAALAEASKSVHVEQIRLQHAVKGAQELHLKLEKIGNELQEYETIIHRVVPIDHQATVADLQNTIAQGDQQVQTLLNNKVMLREAIANTEKLLHQEQDNFHHLNSQQAALIAILHATQQPSRMDSVQWAQYPRLFELLIVEPTWQSACQIVMNDALQAIVVDSLDAIWPNISELQQTNCLFTCRQPTAMVDSAYPRLIDKIQNPPPSLWLHLNKIIAATTLADAISWLPFIAADESIITPDGYWLANHWLRIVAADEPNQINLFAKQQELTFLQQGVAQSATTLAQLKEQRDALHDECSANESNLSNAQQSLSQYREEQRQSEAAMIAEAHQTKQAIASKSRLLHEQDALRDNLEALVAQQLTSEQALASAQNACSDYQSSQDVLTANKTQWEQALHDYEQERNTLLSRLHQLELQSEREHFQLKQRRDNIARVSSQQATLVQRLETIAERLIALDTPDFPLTNSLNEKLLCHQTLEKQLATARDELNHLTQQLDQLETHNKDVEKLAKEVQAQTQHLQLNLQTIAVQTDTIVGNLSELGAQPALVLADIPTTVSLETREQSLQEIILKINRLGAINLAAIEEYASDAERKKYLDEQYHDLMEALATLDSAIEKMDSETRQRFQQTFADVNSAFQSLFPRLFGGGRAMLELTCDNLLEAGVLVMAQPPGKRNSTIHLLSGGEKAMTAVALVFAIFQLNPSPFCMLDEVDAPLDDANIERFCVLVREMSEVVQFLFITHNKVTMELADHLIGVTMREPGVSRIVAVDVEQALAITE